MSRRSVESLHTVCWLPWLPICREVPIGNVVFLPFSPNDPGAVTTTSIRDLRQFARCYVDMKGKPVQQMCIATWEKDLSFSGLTDQQVDSVFRASDLLMLGYLSTNEYFCEVGAYANATLFQTYVQRFAQGDSMVGVRTRRRDGQAYDACLRREVKTQKPVAALSCRLPTMCDDGFLKALKCVAAGSSPHHSNILDSLFFFSLANTDDQHASLRVEAVLSQWSVEHLLGGCEGNLQYCQKLAKVVGPWVKCRLDDTDRSAGQRPKKRLPPDPSILDHWAYEHYELRNKITHGNEWKRLDWRWTIFEHCVFAAWLYPLLVKVQLSNAKEKEYELSDCDTACLNSIGPLLACKDWRNNWTKIIQHRQSIFP